MTELAPIEVPVTGDKKPRMIFVELVDQNNSGFVQDDTINTNTPLELRAPGVRFIPNEGFRRGVKMVDGVRTFYNERIRYIKNETVISLAEQKVLGIEPNPLPSVDKIPIEKGYATVVREGSTVGLFDYISEAFYNESNPDRSEKASAIWRIVEMDKAAEQFNEDELIAADAVKFVGSLYQKIGKNTYQYNEDKINAVCEMLAIFADTPATKIRALLSHAKQRPAWFLNKVTKLEQTTVTEVTHALELSVIRFNSNTAEYCNKDRVLRNFGSGKFTQDQKIMKLADWLRTADGHEAYMELKAEIEAALNKSLNN
jgi:hypothetical protein